MRIQRAAKPWPNAGRPWSLKSARFEELGRKQAAKIWDLERSVEDLKEKNQELVRKNCELEDLGILSPD